jgi:hypothetical protein
MRKVTLTLFVLFASACAPEPPVEEAFSRGTAAVMLDIRPGAPLDSLLYTLDSLLVNALTGRLEGQAVADFRNAEALTDRLLEARLPFEWIPDQQYSLESRLRQIQSRADRVLAQLVTGAPREPMLTELRELRDDVVRLRETIARGGTRAPPPIERLLHLGDTMPRRGMPGAPGAPTPASPTGPRPLGTPIGNP